MKQIGTTNDGGMLVAIGRSECELLAATMSEIGEMVANFFEVLVALPGMQEPTMVSKAIAYPFKDDVSQPNAAPDVPKNATDEATAAPQKPTKVKMQAKTPAPSKATSVKLARKPGKPKQSWKAELVKIMDGKGVMSVAEVVASLAAAKGINAPSPALTKKIGQCLAGKPNRDAFTRIATGQYSLTANAPVAPAKAKPAVAEIPHQDDNPADISDEQLKARMQAVAKAGKKDNAARIEFLRRNVGEK